jgi:hypothetical protein
MTKPNTRPQNEESDDPDESEALVSFLRANTLSVPEPRLGLEDQLIQTISTKHFSTLSSRPQARSRYRWNGLVAAFIGLGVGAIAIGVGQLYRFAPSGISSAELAQLEPFMVNDWDETMRPSDTILRGWDGLGVKLTPALPANDSVQSSDPPLSDHSES